MKRHVLLLILVLIGNTSSGMEKPAERRAKSPSGPTIKLIATDGLIEVPREVVELSNTIKGMLEELATNEVPLLNIDQNTLQRVVAVGKVQLELSGKEGKEMLDALETNVKSLSIDEKFQLLLAANYLDYPALLNTTARSIAQDLKDKAYLTKKVEKVNLFHWQTFLIHPLTKMVIRDLEPIIAKYYYLLTGQNLQGVIPDSYGFSIRELLNYGRSDALTPFRGQYGTDFILGGKRINDLHGLRDIPDIKEEQSITIEHDKLSILPVGIFAGFDKLRVLNLWYDELSILPVDVFNGLNKLGKLILSYNKLNELLVGVFNGLNNLRILVLNNNELNNLPIDVFKGLTKLENLHLDYNKLKGLRTGVFNGLDNLRGLYISHNQLSELPVDVFKGLVKLRFLDLSNNLLSDAEKKRIREEVPSDVEINF